MKFSIIKREPSYFFNNIHEDLNRFLKETFGDMIVLVCFGSSLPDVIANIKRIADEQELYAPDVPVYGDVLFNMEYAILNRERLENIYNRLADDTSKKVFQNAVMYKLTGRIDYLFECETPCDEVYQNILKFNDRECANKLCGYELNDLDFQRFKRMLKKKWL